MNNPDLIKRAWTDTRKRLAAKGLLATEDGSLSVRCPGGTTFWIGTVDDADPILVDWTAKTLPRPAETHAAIYACRGDVGAIASAGGIYARRLPQFGGLLPQIFDEQARHLGPMPRPIQNLSHLAAAMKKLGNSLIINDTPVCLGITARRLALNVELFEKSVQAYVLAMGAGGPVKPLPWWVRMIANSRLRKDERRAAEAFALGQVPVESRGY